MRLGDLDALRKNMEFVCMGIMAGTEPYNAPLTEIDNAPTVEEKSYEMGYQDGCEDGLQGIRPQGKWITSYDTYNVCSLCNYKTVMDNYKFCPNCGADMKGGAE